MPSTPLTEADTKEDSTDECPSKAVPKVKAEKAVNKEQYDGTVKGFKKGCEAAVWVVVKYLWQLPS